MVTELAPVKTMTLADYAGDDNDEDKNGKDRGGSDIGLMMSP